jgi:hypothetical protein
MAMNANCRSFSGARIQDCIVWILVGKIGSYHSVARVLKKNVEENYPYN